LRLKAPVVHSINVTMLKVASAVNLKEKNNEKMVHNYGCNYCCMVT
jgi:hypothetical protein